MLRSPPRPNGKAIPDPEFHSSALDNGLIVATFPMPWLHEVGATLVIRSGSRFESRSESGLAHFLEHMLFKGTRAIPEPTRLHAHLEALAADMNAATGQETNAFWITLPPDHLEAGFATFCELFTQPAFSGIDTERRVILEEMREDENERGETTNPAVLGGELLWPGHPLSRPIIGNRVTLSRFTTASLHAYMARHYRAGNMILAFCGPVTHAHCLELATRGLAALPAGSGVPQAPPPPMPPGPHWRAVDDQTAQLTLTLHYRACGYREADYHAVSALRRLLDDGFSSRLQATIREEQGLVYDVWAAYTTFADTGVLELGASVSPENLPAVVAALLEQLRLLGAEPPGEAEWLRLMTRWRAALNGSLDRPSELIERYVTDRLFQTSESLADTWKQIQAIDPEALPPLVADLTRPENRVITLVGPNACDLLPELKALFGGVGVSVAPYRQG